MRSWGAFIFLCVFLPTACQSWGRFWETGTVALNGISGRTTGELWSNTLVVTATGPASYVEVSVAGGAWVTVTGSSPWRYKIPASANLRVGKKYPFQARALNDVGNVIATQSVDLVIRQNHDLDGDGYPEAVFSAIAYSSSTGRVYIYSGGKGITSGTATAAPTILTGGGPNQSFGIAHAMGDINGDGYGDLVVGGEQYSSNQGGIWFFYGSANGIATQSAASVPPIPGIAAGDYFGGALALGDANGDGYQDVVVASRERGSSAGTIYLYLGSSSGLAGAAVATKNGSGSDRLGTSVAFLDTNNDGYADIAAGSPTTGNGSVSIFAGTAAGFNTTAIATVTGEAAGDRFGENVFLGDFNNDGYADMITGATQRNAGIGTNQGAAYLLPGSASGFSTFSVSSGTNVVIGGEAASNQFPRSVLVADTNGDGFMDIIISSHLANSNGTVYIFHGQGTFASINAGASSRKIFGITASDGFGVSLGIKDFNADGYPDIFTGAYQRNAGFGANQGTGSVFFGRGNGAATQSAATADATINGENASDLFGYTEN